MNSEGVSSNIKGNIPERCLICDCYHPTFLKTAGKECAVFGTIAGTDPDHCWAWKRKLTPPYRAENHGAETLLESL